MAIFLAIVALIFAGIGIGMNIWALTFAVKQRLREKGKEEDHESE